ncbi:MAG: NTP transferase domain-containing protein [Spirochaetes bacterium]|nr:NTP transferase domain-containing protein [Spirochaetota bacterium]
MPGAKFAAVIPAAGFSSRMGVFKPLLPVGSRLVIEQTVDCFKQAGITDIRVIVGFKRELLTPVLERLGVRIIENDRFAEGMYTSVQAGVRTLDGSISAFFILPADCPFVRPDTISGLAAAFQSKPAGVIYPVHGKRRGHPALVSGKFYPLIVKSNPKGGLKALLEKHADDFMEVRVDDAGINIDMDTAQDYQNVSGKPVRFPSEEECFKLLQDAKVSERVLLHSKEVARVALKISEHMNSMGSRINLGLVMAAGLLHDIAREQSMHAQAGAEIISGLGYGEIADIIAQHMNIDNNAAEALGEAAIVYLADKMVKESSAVPLEERLSESLARFEDDAGAVKNIRERFNKAIIIKNKVENILKQNIESIISRAS